MVKSRHPRIWSLINCKPYMTDRQLFKNVNKLENVSMFSTKNGGNTSQNNKVNIKEQVKEDRMVVRFKIDPAVQEQILNAAWEKHETRKKKTRK
uniref:Uncharacterized protein n=1 Tax=Romanomermis culicivorax TaxID=13658 RepID=A0A915K5R3_ROMCU